MLIHIRSSRFSGDVAVALQQRGLAERSLPDALVAAELDLIAESCSKSAFFWPTSTTSRLPLVTPV